MVLHIKCNACACVVARVEKQNITEADVERYQESVSCCTEIKDMKFEIVENLDNNEVKVTLWESFLIRLRGTLT